MSLFQAPESFVIKSEKIFDFFQFFFLNLGVDVIEIKDALFSSLRLASLRSLAFHFLFTEMKLRHDQPHIFHKSFCDAL